MLLETARDGAAHPRQARRGRSAFKPSTIRESSIMRSGIGSLIYLLLGLVVASAHHYFTHADKLKPLLSAVLAVALWPLLLLGISLHVK
jgi:hypothetical protein